MVDRVSKEKRSKIMASIKSKNTKPELALQKALDKKGLEFEIHYGVEKIDIAFPKKKLAIFVDGCFWHGCPVHGHKPKTNKSYWKQKLAKNHQRDVLKNERLINGGWKILRIWEHELKNMDNVIKNIQSLLKE